MLQFTAIILKFDKRGERTNWHYIEVPAEIIRRLNHWKKTGFRVKGLLDNFKIKQVALLPDGRGGFILPVNAKMRKGTGKKEDELLIVSLDKDRQFIPPDEDFLKCMEEEPAAKQGYVRTTASERNYFNKWIAGAKTDQTKADRIA